MLSLKVLILALVQTSLAADMCYCKDNDTIYSSCRNAVPCGPANSAGYSQCCAPGDTCGAHGFCVFTHAQNGTSGFYLGSCTDASFKDASCPQACNNFPSEDVVFNASSGLWSCCYGSSGVLDCSNPGQETFQAPTPEDLFAVPYSLLGSTSTSSSANPTSQSSASNATSIASSQAQPSTNTSQGSVSQGLGTGAIAGIGVGAAILIVAVLTIIAMFLIRRSRNRKDLKRPMREFYEKQNRSVHEIGGWNAVPIIENQYDLKSEQSASVPNRYQIRTPLRSELPTSEVRPPPSELGTS